MKYPMCLKLIFKWKYRLHEEDALFLSPQQAPTDALLQIQPYLCNDTRMSMKPTHDGFHYNSFKFETPYPCLDNSV